MQHDSLGVDGNKGEQAGLPPPPPEHHEILSFVSEPVGYSDLSHYISTTRREEAGSVRVAPYLMITIP